MIKPASQAPLSALRLVEALQECRDSPGVLNYVSGAGSDVGTPLVANEAIRAVPFTGSCEVGSRVYDLATRRRIRVQLEMGGKNPTVVLRDSNLDYATDILVNGVFFHWAEVHRNESCHYREGYLRTTYGTAHH